jgi:hypothetical protein
VLRLVPTDTVILPARQSLLGEGEKRRAEKALYMRVAEQTVSWSM